MNLIPHWLKEFRNAVSKLKKKSDGQLYWRGQPSLKYLLRHGRGNCVAWNNPLRSLAIKNRRKIIIVYTRKWLNKVPGHCMGLVIESDGTVYVQDVMYVNKSKVKITTPHDPNTIPDLIAECLHKYQPKERLKITRAYLIYGNRRKQLINYEITISERYRRQRRPKVYEAKATLVKRIRGRS